MPTFREEDSDCPAFFKEWRRISDAALLNTAKSESWDHGYITRAFASAKRFARDDRVRIRHARRRISQVKVHSPVLPVRKRISSPDRRCHRGDRTATHCLPRLEDHHDRRYPERSPMACSVARPDNSSCYSWITGIAEVALVVFVRKRPSPEIQYLKSDPSTEEQRREFGRLVENRRSSQIEAGSYSFRTPGSAFHKTAALSCPHLGLCQGNQLAHAVPTSSADRERANLIGLTNLTTNGRVFVEPKLNRRRALFVLDKVDEILSWERHARGTVGMQATVDSRPIHRVYVDGFWIDEPGDGLESRISELVKATSCVTVASAACGRRMPAPQKVLRGVVWPDHAVSLNDHCRWWMVAGADWASSRSRSRRPGEKGAIQWCRFHYEDAVALRNRLGSVSQQRRSRHSLPGRPHRRARLLSGEMVAAGMEDQWANTFQTGFPTRTWAGIGCYGSQGRELPG